MASASQSHPAFPSRQHNSNIHPKLPERNLGAPSAPFGGGASNARFERERQERERAATSAQQQKGPSFNDLNDEQKEEINEAFGLFDLDKDSRIDYHEFKVALKALGFDLPKSEIMNFLTTHGVPPASNPPSREPCPPNRLLITLPAFMTIASQLIANRDPREEILRAFELFDTENHGIIRLEDLRRVARELGEGLEEDELTAMIEEFDLEGKGGVGREEFIGICLGS